MIWIQDIFTKVVYSDQLLGAAHCIHANLVILATAVTYYQLSGGESWTLRWLRSLLDKMDISCQTYWDTTQYLYHLIISLQIHYTNTFYFILQNICMSLDSPGFTYETMLTKNVNITLIGLILFKQCRHSLPTLSETS